MLSFLCIINYFLEFFVFLDLRSANLCQNPSEDVLLCYVKEFPTPWKKKNDIPKMNNLLGAINEFIVTHGN